jgi:hypothetical protein
MLRRDTCRSSRFVSLGGIVGGAALVAAVTFATPLAAQSSAAPDTSASTGVVAPGARVRFTPPWSGLVIQGKVTRRWSDSVSVHPDDEPAPVALRLADMRGLAVSEGRTVSGDAVTKGAIGGAVAAALLGAVIVSTAEHGQGNNAQTSSLGVDVAFSALFGAIAGGIGGALHAPEHWRAVAPPAPAAPAAP